MSEKKIEILGEKIDKWFETVKGAVSNLFSKLDSHEKDEWKILWEIKSDFKQIIVRFDDLQKISNSNKKDIDKLKIDRDKILAEQKSEKRVSDIKFYVAFWLILILFITFWWTV